VFSKLSQCPDLRFAIGRVRAWVPFRSKPALFAGTELGERVDVLFFNVTSASGLAVNGKSIGRALSSRRFGGKRMTTRGTMDKKRSLSRSDREGVRQLRVRGLRSTLRWQVGMLQAIWQPCLMLPASTTTIKTRRSCRLRRRSIRPICNMTS
jgi:hypothetical protein